MAEDRSKIGVGGRKTLRPVVRASVPSPASQPEKGGKLKAMKCWPEVERRLMAGFPIASIVTFIQEDQKEYLHCTPESLRVMLYDYRRTAPEGMKTESTVPKFAAEALSRLDAGIDEVNELGELYKIQMKRIGAAITMEEGFSGLLQQNTTIAIAQAAKLLMQRADLKIRLGIVGGEKPKDEGPERVKERYGPGVAELVRDPEARGKVISLVRRLAHARGYEQEDIDEVLEDAGVLDGTEEADP